MRSRLALLNLLLAAPALLHGAAVAAEVPVAEDATWSRTSATALDHRGPHLRVRAGDSAALLRFDLSVLPPSVTGGAMEKATLRLWVSGLSTPCDVEARAAPLGWSGSTAPGLPSGPAFLPETPPAASRRVTSAGEFLALDVTEMARAWVDGWIPNHGFMLTSPGAGCGVRLDSSENQAGGHEPRLEIALSGVFGPQTTEAPLSLEGPPGPPGPAGPPGAPGPPLNARHLALERWYDTLQTGLAHGGGSHPIGLLFDGRHLWAASWEDDRIRKINLRHGDSEGYFMVGDGPVSLAFDGSSIWVTNYLEDTVSKVRPADGVVLATVPVGDGPDGVAFDGEQIWVANRLADTLSKIRPSDGFVLGTFPVGDGPREIAIDGTDLWVTTTGSGALVRVRTSDGAVLGSTGGMTAPVGLAYDGERVWVADWGGDAVAVYSAADGSLLQTLTGFSQPFQMVFDGYSIWVTNSGDDTVTRLRVPDGSVLATLPTMLVPEGIAFDGTHVWVGNSRSSTVNKY